MVRKHWGVPGFGVHRGLDYDDLPPLPDPTNCGEHIDSNDNQVWRVSIGEYLDFRVLPGC